MVAGMGINVLEGDGNNAFETHRILSDAVEGIRSGQGPWFLEFSTYRWREHCGPNFDNDIGYRSQKEFELWQRKDPIYQLEQFLQERNPAMDSIINAMSVEIKMEIAEAFEYAENSPFPLPEEAYTGIYA